MNPNNSSHRRNRSGTPQQDPNQQSPQGGYQPFPHDPNQQIPHGGFQPYSHGYPPFSQIAMQQMSQNFQPFPQSFQGSQPSQGFQPYPQVFQGSQPSQHQLPTTPNFNLNDDDDDDEIVPDTQEPSGSTPSQNDKGKKKKFENRAKAVRWTREEEIALAKAWVDVSEDPVVGNAQTGGGFWKRVVTVFESFLGEKTNRNPTQVNSKWNSMNTKITLFSGIYNNLMNNRASGQSDDHILSLAYQRFQSQSFSPFGLEHAWEVVKDCPKWNMVATMPARSSRVSKRSSNDDDEVNVVELERPTGRDRAKRASRGTNSESSTELVTDIHTLRRSVETSTEYRMKKLDLDRERLEYDNRQQEIERDRLKLEKNKALKEDLDFYISPHDHLTGTELIATMYRKQQLKDFYGWEF